MIYFDTSFIAPAFIEEQKSEWVTSKLQTLADEKLTLSQWGHVEFASLIARRVRMKEISASDAAFILHSFEEVATDSFTILIPTVMDFNLASSLLQCPCTGLRAGDALHLAIAKNHNVKTFCTLDKEFIKAIKQLNIPLNLVS
jgi:uncharacterized protein